jgi:putative ABC transport system substrate-binding protein
MKRRTFIGGLTLLLAGSQAVAQGSPVHRLGILLQNPDAREPIRSVLVPDLHKYGFTEGKNLVLDIRSGPTEQLPRLALELVSQQPGALITVGGLALVAAASATNTVPIISFGPNPVTLGLARSLSHPGGNVTGVVILVGELDVKRLEFVREVLPGAQRIAALINPLAPDAAITRGEMASLAAKTGTEVVVVEATGPDTYSAAYARMTEVGADALAIAANPQFNRDAALLAQLALEARLPTICQWREMAERGCLLSYGPSYTEMWRLMSRVVSSIMKGASPGDLPIEQPTSFELIANVRTARALGLTIPPSLLTRADEVIE